MKNWIPFIFLLPLLNACSEEELPQETFEDFKNNQYDLTLTKKEVYGSISFQLPENFKQNYFTNFTITDNAKTRYCQPLGIHFSVERFSEKDMNREFMSEIIIETDLLNAFHDAVLTKRFRSLDNGSVAIKKETKKSIKFPGIIQVCSGESEYSSDILYYATATLKVKNVYYVFQFATNKDMMDVAYDDFERILATVRIKK